MSHWQHLTSLAVLSWLISFSVNAQESIVALSAQQIDNLGIQVGTAQAIDNVPLFSAPAKVVVPPSRDFIASIHLAGLITQLHAAVGDNVSKGQPLATISSPELLTLQGNYLKALGDLKLANATYQRDKTLTKEGIVSGRDEQASFAAFRTAQIATNEAKQLLQMAGLDTKHLQQLSKTGQLVDKIQILSPASGQILERMASTGGHVDAMSALYRIANLDELWLEINVPQDHVKDIHIGDKVNVENTMVEAVIKVLGQSINPENQTLLARAILKSNSDGIKVGQKLNVQHRQSSSGRAFLLPAGAVIHHDNQTFVFIKIASGFKLHPIVILGEQVEGTVVGGDVAGDEEIALSNTAALKSAWLNQGNTE